MSFATVLPYPRLLALAAALLLALSGTAQAQGMGKLSEVLPGSGQEGIWSYQNSGDAFAMRNESDPGALQYFYLNPEPGSEGSRRVQVDVTLEPGPDRSNLAGLLYGFDPQDRSYFLFVLDPGGLVSLYRRDASGFSLVMQSETDAVRQGANRLAIAETGNQIALSLNDTRVGEIGMPGTGQGGVGIAAAGMGGASFTGFSVSRQGAGLDSAPLAAGTQQATGQTLQPQTPNDQAASGESLRLKPVQVVDQSAPFGAMTAYTTLLPLDWKTEGGVTWNPASGCHKGPQLVWGAGSNDDRYGFALLPTISWGATNYGPSSVGCIKEDLTDAEMALRAYLRYLPALQAEIVKVERPPEIQALVQQLGAMVSGQTVPGLQAWADGVVATGRAVLEGRPSDVAFIVVTSHFEGATPDGYGQGGMLISRNGNMAFLLAVSTPPGELENGHPALGVVMGNLRENPQWRQRVNQWFASQRRPNTPSIGAGSGSGSGQSVGDMMFESWKKREGMKDAGQQRSVAGIWETQRYSTTDGNQVSLSMHYKNAWQLNDGTFVLTDDQFFNPVQNFDQFGQQLTPIR